MKMLTIVLVVILAAVPLAFVVGQSPALPGSATALADAERYFAEGSYGRALEAYGRIDIARLSAEEREWVFFRLADSQWRAEIGRGGEGIEQARQRLMELAAPPHGGRIRAEAAESLGDLALAGKGEAAAQQHYLAALDYWASSREVDLARSRYLRIVWSMSESMWGNDFDIRHGRRALLPADVLENALAIAVDRDDRARAAYLLAVSLGSHPSERDRLEEAFELAVAAGPQTEWHDDALLAWARWLEQSGRAIELENGQWRFVPDYPKALELYRQLVRHYPRGASRYVDEAEKRIRNITAPALNVTASGFFLPGSIVEVDLHSRNVDEVRFELFAVELLDAVHAGRHGERVSWTDAIRSEKGRSVAQWKRKIEGRREHEPGSERITLDRDLGPGAYLLSASSASVESRELILVSDTAVVLRTSPRGAVVYVADVITGEPVPSARVALGRGNSGGGQRFERFEATTNNDGIARFEIPRTLSSTFYVAAAKGDRQAFAEGYDYGEYSREASWRIYATTDRPAYRPDEKVQWKVTARVSDGESYRNPSGAALAYEITDPRGSKVRSGTARLNAFGSFWSELDLTRSMPLGLYQVTFRDSDRERVIGTTPLFRLEEYKLPEFRVSVETPEDGGRKKLFRLGDRVSATIRADYYFGGAVANGNVEVVIRQQPFFDRWSPRGEFDWYYDGGSPYFDYGGGTVVVRETLRIEADGTAVVSFPTPRDHGGDLEYVLEARVTDASRREVTGRGVVRVTRQSYAVHALPEHAIHYPKSDVEIDFHAADANRQPVVVTGIVRVTRQRWTEKWISPEGKVFEGEDLERMRESSAVFPPPPSVEGHPWRVVSRLYEQEPVLVETLTTGADGAAHFRFRPDRDGFYRIEWTSDDRGDRSRPKQPSDIVRAETAIWVASNGTTRLGYHHGGVELILDRDTFLPGTTAPVMIVSSGARRNVLFSIESGEVDDTKLVRLDGNVKLVTVDVGEAQTPNFFVSAALVHDGRLLTDTKQINVPPVHHFVEVEVGSDVEEYRPGSKGRITVTARDHEGEPVKAEVALSVADDAVQAIQGELAGDPRLFFFGAQRPRSVRTSSSFDRRRYLRVSKRESERQADQARELAKQGVGGGVAGGVVRGELGGVITDRASGAMADGAPPPPASVAEAITVTADNVALDSPGDAGIVVRSDFRSTALWIPDVVTDGEGRAEVEVSWPDSLTTWRATATAATEANQFGRAVSTARTSKPLLVRLQAPRFLVVGDEVTLSAVINNNSGAAMRVAPALEVEGLELLSSDGGVLEVPAHGDVRADWTARVRAPGMAKLRVFARSPSASDAMERSLPVVEHGIDRLVAVSGKARGADTIASFDLPSERKNGTTELVVQVTPSIAVTMLDALPYLIEFPYGCTEQTMSRFLPAVIVSKTLTDLGMRPEDVASRLFGGIEPATAATHPKGRKGMADLDAVVAAGLARLYDFQQHDGGWGWWKEGESDPYMSGYVVWGLALAADAGVAVDESALNRGVQFLETNLVEKERDYETQAWMLHALAVARKRGTPGAYEAKAIDNVWTHRERLRPYSKALFALALHATGSADRARTLLRNLEDAAVVDRAPDRSVVSRGGGDAGSAVMATARWGETRRWWRWSDGAVESTAFALRALIAVDPDHRLIEPAMNWLVKNRRGAQWNNTKDTAIAVLALNDHLRRSGELEGDISYRLSVNGTEVTRQTVAGGELLRAPSRFVVDPAALHNGRNEVRIERTSGHGPLYFSAEARFFSLEEPVTASGNEIFVRRDYYRLVPVPTLLEGYVHEREPLRDGASIASGERIEVVVTVETKNDYEYLMFEDLKPAGFEAVALQSGEPLHARRTEGATAGSGDEVEPYAGGEWRSLHQELRDRKVAIFADRLEQGSWQIRYTLRAETPGTFHALPLIGQAMYVPEIRANGEEVRVRVTDEGSAARVVSRGSAER